LSKIQRTDGVIREERGRMRSEEHRSATGAERADADPHARFLALFLRGEKEIFRYVAALIPNVADAQDVVQQTALALWRKFDLYDSAQPFTPWACRFALLEAQEFLRKQQRWRAFVEGGLAEELARRRQELDPEFGRRFHHLEECVRKLPGYQRDLIEGYYYRRAAVDELAAVVGRSVEAVYKSLQRIRRTLLECVTQAMQAEELA
jgi:RNA polymerase sigma-70 factor (ECF subfamily)